MSQVQDEFYPIKTAKRGTIHVLRSVAGPPPLGWGVSFGELKQTLNKCEKSEKIQCGRARATLDLRRLSDDPTPCHVLAVVHEFQTAMVRTAIRIYPDLGDLDALSPREILAAFVERFGVEFQIGDSRGKLFLEQTVPIPPSRKKEPIVRPGYVSTFPTLIVDTQGDKMNVATAFCIDMPAYTQWTNSW